MNLCARLQIDLARLRLFQAKEANTYAVARSYSEAQKVLAGYQEICGHLHPLLGNDPPWVYPILLKALAEMLRAVPLTTVLESVGYPAPIITAEEQRIGEVARRLREVAANLNRQRATTVLYELAEYLIAHTNRRSPVDDGLYPRVAKLAANQRDADAYSSMVRWSRRSDEFLRSDAQGRLYELLKDCPFLRPGKDVLSDLLERMGRLLYVPLVFDNDRTGIAVPIEVEANYEVQCPEPMFVPLDGNGTGQFSTSSDFKESIKAARERACGLLSEHNLHHDSEEFQVVVRLPLLHLRSDGKTLYDQSSLITPAALAIFCQHPALQRSSVRLNPEVMATGPIRASSLEPKYDAFTTVGEAARLVITSNEQVKTTGKQGVRIVWHNKSDESLRVYLSKQDQDTLKWHHSKVLSFGEGYGWDDPLHDLRYAGRSRRVPLKAQQLDTICAALTDQDVVQLEGIPGIGKSVLVAQCLAEIQDRYDLVLHTSLPDYPDARLPSRWITGALDQLASRLDHARGLPDFAKRLQELRVSGLQPASVVDALVDALPGGPILWVIDNSQALVNEFGVLGEPTLRTFTHRILGSRTQHKLLFVTNHRITSPRMHSVVLDQNFSFEDACWYLDRSGWRYPRLRNHVAQLIGSYPRALAILAGHAADYYVPESAIQEIIQALPSSQGDEATTKLTCDLILGRVLTFIKDHNPSARDLLNLASTFIRSFDAGQLKRLLPIITTYPFASFHRDLDLLRSRNLVHSAGTNWWLHTIVRRYLQDEFRNRHQEVYRQSHVEAGKVYFPLTQQGRLKPTTAAERDSYSDSVSSSTALFHFEEAEFDQGVIAVSRNAYESRIDRARWLVERGRTPTHPLRGYVEAERILGELITIYDPQIDANSLTPGSSVPGDVNVLYAKALHRQKRPEKYERALRHYREAVYQKGLRRFIPGLISVLCDLEFDAPHVENPFWLEAAELFEEMSRDVQAGRRDSFVDVGEAYEKTARHYIALHEFDLATIVLEEAADAKIKWDRIYLLASQVAEKHGLPNETAAWLLRGMDPEVVPQSGPLWMEYYVLHAAHGKTADIPKQLRFVPRGTKIPVALAGRLVEAGFVDAAKVVLQDALTLYPNNAKIWETLCAIVAKTAKPRKVVNTFRRAIQMSPGEPTLYASLGQFLELQCKRRGAVAAFELGTQRVPQEGKLYILLAKLFERLGQLERAKAIYERGLREVRHDPNLNNAFGRLLIAMRADQDAESALVNAIDEFGKDSGQINVSLAQLRERQGRSEESEEAYRKAIETSPTYFAFHIALASYYERLSQRQKAVDVCIQALSKVRRQAPVHVALGRLYEKDGQFEQAMVEFEAAIEGSEVWGYLAKAQLQAKSGNLSGARDTYNEACERTHPFAPIYVGLAQVTKEMGRVDEALDALESGIERLPGAIPLYIARGTILEGQGKWLEAEAVYRAALTEVPSRAGRAHLALIYALEKQGRINDAEDAIRDAILLYPKWPTLLQKAGEFFRQYGEPSVQQGQLDLLLADLREKDGRLEEAEILLRNTLSSYPECTDVYVALGQCCERRNRAKEADELFRAAIARTPRRCEGYLALAASLSVNKDLDSRRATEPSMSSLSTSS